MCQIIGEIWPVNVWNQDIRKNFECKVHHTDTHTSYTWDFHVNFTYIYWFCHKIFDLISRDDILSFYHFLFEFLYGTVLLLFCKRQYNWIQRKQKSTYWSDSRNAKKNVERWAFLIWFCHMIHWSIFHSDFFLALFLSLFTFTSPFTRLLAHLLALSQN